MLRQCAPGCYNTSVGEVFCKGSHGRRIPGVLKRGACLSNGHRKLMALRLVWKTVTILVQATKGLGETVVQATALVLVSSLADRRGVYVRRNNNLHNVKCQVMCM